MFSSGQITFALAFAIGFIILMIWAYRKDRFSNKTHFKGAYKTIAVIILVFALLFLFVKIRHFL